MLIFEKRFKSIAFMNYLGHLFFSNDDTELMLANLFGDFVKGRDLSGYTLKTQQGITLHRAIDNYIDTHPAVLELLHVLYAQLPKVAGIAVDLYFDHLLAKNWNQFHPLPLDEFLERFYRSVDVERDTFSAPFKQMMSHLVKVNWISYYPTAEGLDKACHGVSSRISFPNELKHGLRVFREHEKKISSAFDAYMKDAMHYFNIHNSK